MFIKIMLSYVLGYLKLSVEGYYIERFINICKNNKITIWNLKRNKEIELYLNVRISEFKKICEIAKKTKCKIKIKNKKGIPFLLHKYKKRKIEAIRKLERTKEKSLLEVNKRCENSFSFVIIIGSRNEV